MVGRVAICCEGKSDKLFLSDLMQHLKLPLNMAEFFMMGGKSFFFQTNNKNYIDLLQKTSDGEIGKVLFVLDADDITGNAVCGGYENTEAEMQKTIKKLDIANISDTYITCDGTKCGYLESLILSTIPDDRKKCIEDFLSCSEFESKENHKAILNQIYKAGYPNAPFDLEHPNFDELKEKLKNLFK